MRQLAFFVIFLSACSKSNHDFIKYQDGQQLLTLNATDEYGQKIPRPTVQMIAPDSVKVGEEFLAKIFLSDSSEHFIVAFTDCVLSDTLSIDTTTFQLSGCRSKLFNKQDTVFLAFRPQTAGVKTFQPIKIVTRDKRRVLRTLDHTFHYKVVDN